MKTKFAVLLTALVMGLFHLSTPASADPTLPGGVNPDNPETFSVLPDNCTYGQTTACVHQNYGVRPTVIVWGDSHAAQMIPAIEGHTANRQHNLISFVTGLCPPFVPAASDASQCANRNRQFFSYLQNLVNNNRRVTVVVGGYWHFYLTNLDPTDPRYARAKAFRDGEVQMWNHLASRNVRLLAIAMQPTIPADLQGTATTECQLEKREGDTDQCSATKMLPDQAAMSTWLNDRVQRTAVNRVADTLAWLCPTFVGDRDRQCNLRSGGADLFFDVLHRNVNYTIYDQAQYRWAVE